jgi:insecticidal toxin
MTAEQSTSIKTTRRIEQIVQHQDNMKMLIDVVQPQVAGKRIYASTFSDATQAANTDEPAAKKRLTVITATGCIGTAHTLRFKREICLDDFEKQEVEISHSLFEKHKQTVEFLHNQGKTLNAAYEMKDGQFIPRTGVTDEIAQAGLNAMYAIQALMDINQQDDNQTTQPIIQLQTYLGWAQIAQSTVQDADSLIRVIQTMYNPTLTETASVFGQALSKLGQGLQLASIGLDIAELATAQTGEQRTEAGVKLFFDSSGLLINGGALIAEAAGFEGVAGISSALAVPVAGIGIGITALATQYRQIWNDVQQVGHQFDLYQDAYQKSYEIKNGTLFFPDGQVVTKVDCMAGKIERGSHYIYPTRHPVAWGYWSSSVKNYNFIPWAGDMPSIERSQERAINLRETLGWAPEHKLAQSLPISQLVLPVTPTSYLTPSYNLCPGATTALHGAGFEVLSTLETQSPNFAFNFYCFPGEYAIQHMSSEPVLKKVV